MTIGELLSHLKRVRKAGGGFTSCCPAHEDKNPSLSITEREGRILLHCHAGCNVEAVLAALNLKAADLFLDGERARRVVATYPYFDENEKLLHETVRYEPKALGQRRPDGNGGHVWSLQGVRTVLYNLPAVVKADAVIVCEGEKDVETARKLALVGTCNAMGAGKWKPEYSDNLRGKRVVVIADADAPGVAHAHEVVKSLIGIAEVRLIEALPLGRDLSDFVDRCGDLEKAKELLEALVADAPALTAEDVTKWQPAKAESGPLKVSTTEDLSDCGNADRLVAAEGENPRYCYEMGRWHVWDGRRWKVDSAQQARGLMEKTMRYFLADAVLTGGGRRK